MKLIVVENYDAISRRAGDYIMKQLNENPQSVLGLATGSTPVGVYNHLVQEYNKGFDFSRVATFNLDEYHGLPPDHPQSYRYFMNKHLFNHINIEEKNINIPDGSCDDIEGECHKYDLKIDQAGGIDLQILGLGKNGHIGFNEPDSVLEVRTHITDLLEDTIIANSRFFDSIKDVPKKAVTMGLGTIMKAKKILLLVSGTEKSEILKRIMQPFVDTDVPASVLQLHSDVYVIADRDAASLLDNEIISGNPDQ